jgi:N-acetylneuraminate lyase
MVAFGGAWPALVTPFSSADTVNVSVLRDLTEFFVEKGAGGLYLCGSTGQGVFMSVGERRLVVETAINQVRGRIPVIVHVGSVSLRDAVDLAQHAHQVGVDGISSIVPPFYRDALGLRTYFDTLAASVPDLPFLPYLFGGPSDAVQLMRGLMQIPNLAGTKYTGPNMYELNRIVELGSGHWSVFSGMDEQCLFAAMSGATGNIGSTLNIMIGVYQRMRTCFEQGDLVEALNLQLRANKVTSVLHAAGFVGALREALLLLGFDCGKPRLPGLPLSPERRENLHQDLETAGFAALAAM